MATNIGEQCAKFRKDILNMSLHELSVHSGTNDKTLWAFEHGKSHHTRHLWAYYYACENTHEQEALMQYIFRG